MASGTLRNTRGCTVIASGRANGSYSSESHYIIVPATTHSCHFRYFRPVQSPASPNPQPALLPRFGHSMVLDPLIHTLFIFAGQRDDKYLSDMYAYDIVTNTVSELFSNFSASGGPDACFTQRAVVDPKLKEVYVCVNLLFLFPFSFLLMLIPTRSRA